MLRVTNYDNRRMHAYFYFYLRGCFVFSRQAKTKHADNNGVEKSIDRAVVYPYEIIQIDNKQYEIVQKKIAKKQKIRK